MSTDTLDLPPIDTTPIAAAASTALATLDFAVRHGVVAAHDPLAVALEAVNVFGGFLVTRRMLEMFRKKDKKVVVKDESTKETAK